MERRSSLKVAALLGALVALGSACAEDGASLHVVCPIKPELDDDKCTFDPESEACEFKGALNLAAASQYDTALSVESGLKPRGSDVPVRAEPNRISLTGGTVELRGPSGGPIEINQPGFENPYDFNGAGSVSPGGRGFMSVTLIPKKWVDKLRENALGGDPQAQVVLAVTVRGVTDGGKDVESSEWLWPVTLSYQSPVVGEGCVSMDYCASLGGVDGFADACLCTAQENNCAL